MNTSKHPSATATGLPVRGRAGRSFRHLLLAALLSACPAKPQTPATPAPLTWQQVKQQFEATNPTLKATRLNIDESKAAEITAFLRPNPDIGVATDGTQLTRYQGVWRPFAGTQLTTSVSYLMEREHKRGLRRDVARQATTVAETTLSDVERGLVFNLRNAFVQALQAKAVLQNATENLEYWDKELAIDRVRFGAGDIAQVDLNRLLLQRVQFQSDYESALVNLRTAKIQLLNLLNDRTPVDKFDVKGTFDFTDGLQPLEQFHRLALDSRPDLKVAMQNVELARRSYKLAVANGSTDPTFSVWLTRNPSFNNPYDYNTLGASVNFPLRIFDRNQGEKARTLVDIGRNERLRDVAEAQVFNDVDSAYVTLVQTLNLLKPYKETYLPLAEDTRNKIGFAYKNGGASLLDFLDAEKALRDTRLSYLNMIGSYLTAAAQMNLAVGSEVMQ
jgi:cobalt-zinc-cadmium efflux system outer membrane protein